MKIYFVNTKVTQHHMTVKKLINKKISKIEARKKVLKLFLKMEIF